MVYNARMKITKRRYTSSKMDLKHENLEFDSRHEILMVV